MSETNYCVNCKWCVFNNDEKSPVDKYMCHHPKLIDVITGEPLPTTCYFERKVKDDCGINGKRFELKETDE
jgi:hypothetical protein